MSSEIIKALKNDNADKRGDAAIELGETKDSENFVILIEALKSENNDYVRHCIISSLGVLGDKRAFDTLNELLTESEDMYAAIKALGELKDERAIGILIEVFNQSDDHIIQQTIVENLAKMGYNKITDVINRILRTNKYIDVRVEAAKTLGELGGEEAVISLIQSMKYDSASSVKMQAIVSLGKIGDNRVITSLKEIDNYTSDKNVIRIADGVLTKL